MARYATSILLGGSLLALASAALAIDPPGAAGACSGQMGIVLSARTPEVDLFDAASGGQRISSIPKAKFPTCLKILETSPSRMLKVDIDGKQVWIQPHMVQTRTDAPPPICRTLAESDANSTAGATRGLGEGC
jgi:hypothetical protein